MPRLSEINRKAYSEDRLEKVGLPLEIPQELKVAISELSTTFKLEISSPDSKRSPNLPLRAGFKYWPEYERIKGQIDDPNVKVMTVLNSGEVVAFAITKILESTPSTSSIEIIDVDKSYRRSSNFSVEWQFKGEHFSAGIAHILIYYLIEALPGKLITDATNSRSRFVFKSLGFRQKTSAQNPCLLERNGDCR